MSLIANHFGRFIRAATCRKLYTIQQPTTLAIDVNNTASTVNESTPAIKTCNDDLSMVTPNFTPTFNVAAYVNKSDGLQKLLALNVNLSKIEKKPHIMRKLLTLDFEKDIKKYIFFLNDYISEDSIGPFITKNPEVLLEQIEDLQVRVNYLLSKNFKRNDIQRIIEKNPFWLLFSTIRIDRRLGYFQTKFGLTGDQLRSVAARLPRLITYNLHHVNTNSFVIKEEMGFNDEEIQSLLLVKPKLWMIDQLSLSRRFNYIHNTIKLSHETILQYPGILLCREFRLRQRHTFLEKLNRAQYDCKKENFVPPIALAEGTDVDFCKTYAKCTVDDFNCFLKTL